MFETETNPHYRDGRPDTAAPFHRDEAVRIGKPVHLRIGIRQCAAARIIGHPTGVPDEEEGRVYLAIDYPPFVQHRPMSASQTWPRAEPGRIENLDTWHYPRACPDGL